MVVQRVVFPEHSASFEQCQGRPYGAICFEITALSLAFESKIRYLTTLKSIQSLKFIDFHQEKIVCSFYSNKIVFF